MSNELNENEILARAASEQINDPIRWDLMRAAEARNRPRAQYTPLRTVLGLGVVDTMGNVAWFAALLGSAFAMGFALAVTIISGGFKL